ncbi:hypothetical protein HID58_062544 [Brassica napus]|uniref:Uncharacterized protein n=1 Tax=Brassica napus TaxID=3708 RepID=A0ABQ8A2I7_BRANA|nr:hypothetical protein HID58_062544 [Brassica napus]
MTIFRTQIPAMASNIGYVVAPPLPWRPGNPFQSQNETVRVLNSTIIPRMCRTFALYRLVVLNNVMVCGFTSRGIGLHKLAKFENEQQELLRFPQTLFDTKMPAEQWRSMAGIDLLCIWKIDKSCEKIGAQVSQKLIVVHGIILLSLTAANTYDPQTLQMESEARGRSLVFSLYGGIYLFQSDSNVLRIWNKAKVYP